MPRTGLIAILCLMLVLAPTLAGCKTDTAEPATLTPDETPVPAGMPVMYEFFTLS
ncbi:MAG: hypothetical protein JXA36_05025 [Coriobacteriia bacterium]|nr:hypothetical protein [Coriobacteriia bacterium]